jgi:hypothetical protein
MCIRRPCSGQDLVEMAGMVQALVGISRPPVRLGAARERRTRPAQEIPGRRQYRP